MTDTCGPTSALPSMRYDLASSSWRTSEATSLWDLEMSSPTFPEWGMTRDGECYELPMPALPTVAPASSSSLLPTPTVQDGENTAGPSQLNRNTLPLNTLVTLLPTPTVMDMGANYTPEEWQAWKDAQKAAHRNGNGHGASLTQEAISLLPTPKATNNENQQNLNQYGPNLGMALMPEQYEWDRGAACQEEASVEDGTIGETATTPMLF